MAEITPESDLGSIDCYQNYTAPEVFVQGLAGIIDQQDVECIIRAQKQMLQRFEKTNEMLSNCNNLCLTKYKLLSTEFKNYSHLLCEVKKDLENIFKRIQAIKTKIIAQYPDAMALTIKKQQTELENRKKKSASDSKLSLKDSIYKDTPNRKSPESTSGESSPHGTASPNTSDTNDSL